METIAPDIRTWAWFSTPHGYNFNGLLIAHPEGNICIDPVQASADDVEEIVRARPARVLLTNRNHVRAANLIRERTGARVAIHPADAAYARSQGASIDDELRVGETGRAISRRRGVGQVARRGCATLARSQDTDRGRRGDWQPARPMLAAARAGDGRSAAPARERAEFTRDRFRHLIGRRRCIHIERRAGSPERTGCHVRIAGSVATRASLN